MRSLLCSSLVAALAVAVGATGSEGLPLPHWPHWPWPHQNTTTTTPPPESFSDFAHGVADALGFADVSGCMQDTSASVRDMWAAANDYIHGNWVSKAKALVKFGEAMEKMVVALRPCSDVMTDAAKYRKLVGYLQDPRYYSVHNALTLALNAAEERKQLDDFASSWEQHHLREAGAELATAVLDVLDNPSIPSSNGTAAAQFAAGLAEGFAVDVDLQCFRDARVEIPAVVGGVLDIMSVVDVVGGLESLFHGLEGLVPSYKACMADKPKIVDLLKTVGDFRHPSELAKQVGRHVLDHKLDLSLEAAAAVLDSRGKEWERLGQDVGKILSKILLDAEATSVMLV